jgi:DNA-binding NarL/FixJ family response regulator
MIRVVLAEDHHVVRAAVAALLGKESDIQIVGQAAETTTLIKCVNEVNPDVLVLDAHMPGQKVIETAKILRTQHPGIHILVLSAYDRSEYVVGLLGAGASGYVLKDDPPETLALAVRAVARGERWLSPRVSEVLLKVVDDSHQPLTELTEREMEILRLMVSGYRNEQISVALSVTEQTVKNHIRNIFSKLDVQTRVEAILYAIKEGVTPIEKRSI